MTDYRQNHKQRAQWNAHPVQQVGVRSV